METTDIRAQLDEERRIIDDINLPPLEMEGFGDGEGTSNLTLYAGSPYNPDVEVVADTIRRPTSAVRLKHSWNALPVRNAQLETVLAECEAAEAQGRMIDPSTLIRQLQAAEDESGVTVQAPVTMPFLCEDRG